MKHLTIAASAAFLLSATAAFGQMSCGPRANILAEITGPKYLEVPMIELDVDGTESKKLTLYSNYAKSTWTLIGYPRPGIACIVAGGKAILIPEMAKPDEKKT